MGIPFALVNPDNPFGDALPGPKFEGIFEANDDSAICPQIQEFNKTVTGNLYCLHLNIYVPTSAGASNRLPVMVYIYGGQFDYGFSSQYVYGPQHLVRHDVILITLNYRVGPYGFMCLDIPRVPGNSGLKDQRRGLRWIRDNIAAFGGDTSRITVFGISTGAMSVELHILSPGSNGLFQRGILQSGSSVMNTFITHSRPNAPLELAEYLGLSAKTAKEALEIIKHVHTDDVVLAGNAIGLKFSPCVEKHFEGVESFIREFPDLTLASGQYEHIPMIMGYNSDEYTMRTNGFIPENYFEQYQNIFYDRINSSFEFRSDEQLKIAAKIVRQFYIGTKPINKEILFDLLKFDGDFNFCIAVERSINYHRAKSNQPIYQYVFAYSGGVNFSKKFRNITEGGAIHADDVAYLFKQLYTPELYSTEDQLITDRMTTMWTNFVKFGNPTPEVSELLPVRWPEVSDEREYLWIDSDLKIDRKPFHSRIAFWDLFFDTFGEYFRMFWW